MKFELKKNRTGLNVGDMIVCDNGDVYMIGKHVVLRGVCKIDLATGGVIGYDTLRDLEEDLRECGVTYRILPSYKLVLKEI